MTPRQAPCHVFCFDHVTTILYSETLYQPRGFSFREGGYKMDACWSVVIISNLPLSLTRSRGEYLRVVGILEMVE